MADTPQMLTPKTVAEILGVHQKTVHVWLRTGKLPGIKISYRAWRIPRTALDQFIEKNSNVPSQKGAEGPAVGSNDTISDDATPALSAGIHGTPQVTMKRYLQDIMGEEIPDGGHRDS